MAEAAARARARWRSARRRGRRPCGASKLCQVARLATQYGSNSGLIFMHMRCPNLFNFES
eukprot:6183653-Pleurochrysis_carterae.AAC.6